MDADNTGIHFRNDVPYTEEFNTYTYRNFYNGGGVALGDINNDGLIDIYFTGNLNDNKLYLNKGNWVFEDITEKAGVACTGVWSTGVTMVDINGDGLLDIYVCKAGPPGGTNRHNELFINQGDLTFKESAAEYGLDIIGLSIHASFFDYDNDGDLDCYLLSNSIRSVGGFELFEGQRDIPSPEGNKLLRNDNGFFVDVSGESGIYSSKIGYGLGITLSDFNGDNKTDIFISNDFFEKDYLYLNQGDGTFKEISDYAFPSLSMGSMGADASDLDNDLLPDLFVTEMLPRDHERKKTKNHYETWDKYVSASKGSYHHQFSRNSLHRNIGNHKFLDISRFAGVADTDWSWASLAQDFDNDGLKDLFVSNGIYKDLLDKDYLNFSANATMIKSMIDNKEEVLTMLVDSMSSVPVKNCMFKNIGDMKFNMVSDQWGLHQLSFSNGSAYADLDNDGDLDLVVNNVNMPSFVYRNNLDTAHNRSIRFKLRGDGMNTFAIGAKIIIKYNGLQSLVENYPSRGFQSSVELILHFGTGSATLVDTVIVIWPDERSTKLYGLATNKTYTLLQKDSQQHKDSLKQMLPMYNCTESVIDFKHDEIDINLFTRERLLMEMNGFQGPAMAIGDVNGDGVDDIFCGGGKNQTSALYVSKGNGYEKITDPFENEYRSESVKAFFQDIDLDGDLDLYVAHGGKTFSNFSPELHDVLYINEGDGKFTKAQPLPFPEPVWTGDVTFSDLNNNGLTDIIVAEKGKTDLFGLKGSIYILYNQGQNKFKCEKPTSLVDLGMMTGIESIDVNQDGYDDLVVAGLWMPINIIHSDKGYFEQSKPEKIEGSSGLWNVIHAYDVDGNGELDIMCGNIGLNSFYQKGMIMYVNDFDDNGMMEQIICYQHDNKYYPIHDLDEMYSQLPSLKKKYNKYSKFASADMTKLFSSETLKASETFKLEELRSVIFMNKKGKWDKIPLPDEIQYSSVHAIHARKRPLGTKMYFGGNKFNVKPQFGRQDASYGWSVNLNNFGENIQFTTPISLYIGGQIRYINWFNEELVLGMNNDLIVTCKEWE